MNCLDLKQLKKVSLIIVLRGWSENEATEGSNSSNDNAFPFMVDNNVMLIPGPLHWMINILLVAFI